MRIICRHDGRHGGIKKLIIEEKLAILEETFLSHSCSPNNSSLCGLNEDNNVPRNPIKPVWSCLGEIFFWPIYT